MCVIFQGILDDQVTGDCLQVFSFALVMILKNKLIEFLY